ncbi:hypothetical protein H6785_01485 [Candidatus Nomurabacteria bacterium]|nr:hypothetical protein [Candidatus Kaiserbacteria bacterium]MCB9815240.1 hypothetical protein [Candidatus Nomurabacteria bacterium]
MSKSTTTMIIISLLVFAITSVGFGLMVFQVSKQGDRLAQQVEALKAEREQENSYNKLQQVFKETKNNRSVLTGYFLESQGNSIDFLNLVESLAPVAGVTLETDSIVDFEDKEAKTHWIVTTFSFSGSRERVQNFIKILETVPYVARLISTDISLQSSSLWGAKVTIQVQILDYEK